MTNCPGHSPASLGYFSLAITDCPQAQTESPALCAGTGSPSLVSPPTPELPMAPHTPQTHEAPAGNRAWAELCRDSRGCLLPQTCQAGASSFHPCLTKSSSGTCQPVPTPQGHRGPPRQHGPSSSAGRWLGTAEGSWGPPVPACQSSRMLGYPGNSDDIAGDAGKLCPRCAGCHRRCQGNSRRHPAGKVGAGVGAWQCPPASPACSPAGILALWHTTWGH